MFYHVPGQVLGQEEHIKMNKNWRLPLKSSAWWEDTAKLCINKNIGYLQKEEWLSS